MSDIEPRPEQNETSASEKNVSLPVVEERMDAANQSLADALRASFFVLKLLMVVVGALFLTSGLFTVDTEEEVVVRLQFGKQKGVYREGIHWAWPYPIDEVIKVPVAAQTLAIDKFGLLPRKGEEEKTYSEMMPRGRGLNPATDGALLTGDRGIMHAQFKVQYRIRDAQAYVRNVRTLPDQDEKLLLKYVLRNAAVASAARTDSDVIWKGSEAMLAIMKPRAQAELDRMETGIVIDNLISERAYPPLQVRDAVNAVTAAEARLQEVVQRARAERDRILNAAAGEAWETIYNDVLLFDQAGDDEARDTILTRIDEQLEQKAAGESGEIIKQAQNERERILLETRARANEFLALLEPYQANSELLREQLLRDMLRRLNAESNIKKWFLPPGDKTVTLWLNPDPEDFRREARERAQAKIEARQAQRGR